MQNTITTLLAPLIFLFIFPKIVQSNLLFGGESEWLDNAVIQVFGSASSGSGIIIGRKDDKYTFITAAHVLEGTTLNDNVEISSLDGKFFDVTKWNIPSDEYDLAIGEFSSSDYFPRAFLGGKLPKLKRPRKIHRISVLGFPLTSSTMRTSGILRKSEGSLSAMSIGNKDGYDLQYTSPTQSGMSGGGVFGAFPVNLTSDGLVEDNHLNSDMRSACQDPKFLLGMHGRGEASISASGKSGTNLGINFQSLEKVLSTQKVSIGLIETPKEWYEELKKSQSGCFDVGFTPWNPR